ncbi:MAG: enoyl-CoA hydratase, partial [Chlorobiales bacterium]|nr:enoyl-CoA hydratase [Chlorobiales bacterium]
MPYQNIQVSREDQSKIAIIQIARPEMLNALSFELMKEVIDALESFDADPNIHAIVLTGSEKAFAAGADIKEMAKQDAIDMLIQDNFKTWNRISDVRKPIIAAVSGYALGGGCELMLICDIVIASETTKIGQPEINIGVIPGAGGTQRLTRAVGKVIAMEMVLNNLTLKADEALQLGLVNRVVPVEQYLDVAIQLAAEIAARAPLAVRLAKEAVNKAFELSLSEGLSAERRSFYSLFASQ